MACIVFPNSLRGACALKTSAGFKASRKVRCLLKNRRSGNETRTTIGFLLSRHQG